jgi:hypothetical protein
MITIAQAFAQFQEFASYMDSSDTIAMCEAWNNYTDSLCKDGELTDLQYHYCPAWDDMAGHDDSIEEDLELILSGMGIRFTCKRIDARRDGLMSDMARHFLCSFWRTGGKSGGFSLEFSQGSAHTESPTDFDVLGCVMCDMVEDSEFTESSFKDWCDEYEYDTDSRQAESTYRAILEQSKAVRDTFSSSEIDGLRQLLCEAGY